MRARPLMRVEIAIVVLENGTAMVFPSISASSQALFDQFLGLVEERANGLAVAISKAVSGEVEDPDVVPLQDGWEPIQPSAPIVKPDRRVGRA
jgi:hypothetical protein